MPASYTIDLGRALVVTHSWGLLSDRELLDHARTLAADSRFRPGLAQWIDFRDVREVAISNKTVRTMATISPFGAGARRALVAPADIVYGLARMFELRRQASDEVMVFRTAAEAVAWLGLGLVESELPALLAAADADVRFEPG